MNALVRPRSIVLLALATMASLAAQVVRGPSTAATSRADSHRAQQQEAQAGCLQPPETMIAWWPLDQLEPFYDGDEDGYRDYSGIDNHGLPVGGPQPVSRQQVAEAIALNGRDQFIRVAAHPELAFGTEDFSIDAWIRIDDEDPRTGRRTIVDKSALGPMDQPYGYSFFVEDGHLGFAMSSLNGPLAAVLSQATVAADWNFVAVTAVRGAGGAGGTVSLYLNGDPPEDFSIPASNEIVDNEADLIIGSDFMTVAGRDEHAFWGEIDEVELFRRALKPDELGAIEASGTAGKCKAPILPTAPASKGANGKTFGNDELVNIDVVNECESDATGFQFVLSSFGSGTVPIPPVYYSFAKVFEVSCQQTMGVPPPVDCNPFTPQWAVPAYSPNAITLGWQSPPNTLQEGHTAHFGYSLWQAHSHEVKAQLMLGSASLCEIVAESSEWSMNGKTITMTLQNQSPVPMELEMRGTALPQPITLEDLVPSNASLMRSLGQPMAGAVLDPGDRLSVSFNFERSDMAAAVLADWFTFDGQRRGLRARDFHGRALRDPAAPPKAGLSLPWVGSAPWPPELNAPGGN